MEVQQCIVDRTGFCCTDDSSTWIIESEKDLPNSSSSQWGFVKHKIGEFSRNYGAKLKKAKNLLKTNIEAELGQLLGFTDLDSKNRYQILKSQLDEIIENEIQGSILRSLCKDYEDGERCTQYFFSLEKTKGTQKTITSLKKADGTLIHENSAILKECRQFYMNLYKKNEAVSHEKLYHFMADDNIPKITEDMKNDCDKKNYRYRITVCS